MKLFNTYYNLQFLMLFPEEMKREEYFSLKYIQLYFQCKVEIQG